MQSLQSFFRSGPPRDPAWRARGGVDIHAKLIRSAMLLALAGTVPQRYAWLPMRIQLAEDSQRLWYLRGDLMQALASMHGELKAALMLARITDMFEDILPAGLASGVARRRGLV